MDLRDTVHVVGLTCEGAVPLLRRRSGSIDTILLPGATIPVGGGAGGELYAVNRELAALGYRAPELVTLSRYGIPTGAGGRAVLLLAPLLARRDGPRPLARGAVVCPPRPRGAAVCPPRPRGAAVCEVPLTQAAAWLREQKNRGALVDPLVWSGVLMAERQFPRWVQERLRASLLGLLHRDSPGTAATAPALWAAERSAPGA